MKNFLILLVLLSLTVGCKKSADSDAESAASASEAQAVEAQTDDAATADDASDETQTDGDVDAAAEDDGASKNADDNIEDGGADNSAPTAVQLDSEITLTSAGASPRKTLSFDFDKVKPTSAEARTDIDSDTQGQEFIIPRVTQRMSITNLDRKGDTLSVTIKSSEPSYESRLPGDEMHEIILQSMRESVDVGEIEFSFDMDAHGNVSNSKIIEAKGSSQDAKMAMSGQLRQFASNYPAEPVGEGAKWTSTSRIDVGGQLVLDTVVHYTLKRLTNDGAVIDLTYDIPDVADAINKANVAGEDEPQITEGTLRGQGTLTIAFDRIIPAVDQTITLDMTLEQNDTPVKSTLKMRTQIVPVD